jgi:membrane protein involved in colicin uptake
LEREDHKFPTHQNEQTRKDSDGSEISVESYTYSDLINYYDTENEKDSQSLDHQLNEEMNLQNAKMMQVGNSGTDNSDSRFVKISRNSQDSDKDYEEIIANLQVENKKHIADKKKQVEENKRQVEENKRQVEETRKYFVKSKKYYTETKRLAKENKRYQDKMNEWKSKYEQLVAEFGKKGKRVKRSINRHI